MNVTDDERALIVDIALGLSDAGIARRQCLNETTVTEKLQLLIQKLVSTDNEQLAEAAGMTVFNVRTRLVFLAMKNGLLDANALAEQDESLEDWLDA